MASLPALQLPRGRAGVAAGRFAAGSWSGQYPDAVSADNAPADEVTQVQGGGPAFEPGVVPGGAAVAELETPAAAAGDLGDDAFDVGPVLAVVLAPGRGGGSAAAGGA